MAGKPGDERGEDAGALTRRIRACRKSIAKAQFDMISNVARMRAIMSDDDLRSFLVIECGVSRKDLQSIFAFDEVLGPFEALLRKHSVPFPVVKALIATDSKTRRAALDTLAAGSDIDVSTIATLRRMTVRSRIGARVLAERARQRAMTAAASAQTSVRVQTLSENVAALLRDIDDFVYWFVPEPSHDPEDDYVDRSPKCNSAALAVKKHAAAVLQEFRSIYGEVELPKAGPGFKAGTHRQRLAAAQESLKRFAEGRFAWYSGFSGFGFEPGYLWRTELQDALEYLLPCDLTPEPEPLEKNVGTEPLKFVEICAGAGGQAIGLLGAGFKPVALYDMDLNATRTLRQNWNWNVRRKRLEKVSDDELRRYHGIDLLAGGVECRAFSRAGKQLGPKDSRNLFDEAVRYVEIIEPRAFFFENVEGFKDSKFIEYRASVYRRLEELDYSVGEHVLNAEDFGLAQSRSRVVLVGIRKNERGLFTPPTSSAARTTMGEALADVLFPYRGQGDSDYDKWAETWLGRPSTNEPSYTVSSNLYKNDGMTKQRWKKIGFEIDPNRIGDGPAPLGSIKDPKSLPYLTVEVARALQGFPKAWRFSGKPDRQFYQIGNAFPPQMSKAIGLAIARALEARQPGSVDAPPLVPFDESLIGVPPKRTIRLNAITVQYVDDLEETYGKNFPDLKRLRRQAIKEQGAHQREMREIRESRTAGPETATVPIGFLDPSGS
ncbi:DNA (cytosine-5-)-methyltransferase [Mesorhizobium sp. KR1-2]|uniref:DNA cytosine methyltransferase n=1 Tax=Mesorhizobium sp. KR1-2 TaxID=3156609 RepID=UPI0032B37454